MAIDPLILTEFHQVGAGVDPLAINTIGKGAALALFKLVMRKPDMATADPAVAC